MNDIFFFVIHCLIIVNAKENYDCCYNSLNNRIKTIISVH
jgi:hypothetical protein